MSWRTWTPFSASDFTHLPDRRKPDPEPDREHGKSHLRRPEHPERRLDEPGEPANGNQIGDP